MLDADGSGALDSDEIIQAFKLINMPTSKAKIVALMGDVLLGDADAELDYEAFELLMTRRINDTNDDSIEEQMVAMPFHEIANAFRRKKTLEAFMNGGQERQKIIDSENFKLRSQRNLRRWRMPHMNAKVAKMFKSVKTNKGDVNDMSEQGPFEDRLLHLKTEVTRMQEEAEASSKMLEIFATSDSRRNSPTKGKGEYSTSIARSKLKSRSKLTTPNASSSSFSRPKTCPPSYLEATSEILTPSGQMPSPDYIPPLTPAPRKLEQEFEDIQQQEVLDLTFESLRKEDVTKMKPQTSAAVDASETRYSAYWRACNKEFFDADIVQAKAQIVLAKVKPPKVELNPWESMGDNKLYAYRPPARKTKSPQQMALAEVIAIANKEM